MAWNEAAEWAGAAILIAAVLLLPKWFSYRQRAVAGAALLVLGWTGIFVGFALGDRLFMQSEAVAYTWVGVSGLAITLAITLLVPVFFEWRRKRRAPRRIKEHWHAGSSMKP